MLVESSLQSIARIWPFRRLRVALTNPDEQVQAFVDDLWEFIEHQKWTVFSIIAVSGGGPSALAFLTSYLDKRAAGDEVMPRLEAVSLVATVCCSAGTQGMMKTNETLVNIASSQDKMLSRFTLNAMFAVSILPNESDSFELADQNDANEGAASCRPRDNVESTSV